MSEIKEGQTMQLPRRKQKGQQVSIKHYTENNLLIVNTKENNS
jgi:glutathione peroxidase-family protein